MAHKLIQRLKTTAALTLACALMSAAGTASAQTITYSPAAQTRLAELSAEQRAFAMNPTMLGRAGISAQEIELALETRSKEQADAYIASLMKVVGQAAYVDGVNMAAIPLDPEATAFNAATVVRPMMFDEYQRTPGPIYLGQYLHQAPAIATFASAPVAIHKEDLIAGKIEVAFMGIPLDLSSGIRDAKHGPMALRNADSLVGTDVYTGINPSHVLRIADYGNIAVDQMSAERTIGHVRKMVAEVAGTGAVPFIVGGDHTLMYPDVAAIVDTYGKGNVTVVQLDANYQGKENDPHFISDNQTVTRLISDGILEGKNLIQVGLRGSDMSATDKARMQSLGVQQFTMAEIEKEGLTAVAARVQQHVQTGPKKVFVSFDMSVLDSAYAPGVGRSAPNGLTMREAVPLVRNMCAQNDIVGFELLDPAPILDISYKTAQNASYILHSCLAGMAQRKEASRQ